MMFRLSIAIFFTLMLTSSASADGLAQLNTFLTKIKTIEGQFEQSVVSTSGRTKQSSGKFSLERPGKFIWSYLKPFPQLIVSNGATLWSYDPDLNQVSVRRVGKALGDSPAALLAGKDIERHFTLKNTADGDTDTLEFIEATPKSVDSTFSMVKIGFSEHALPQKMEIHDNFGQVTTLILRDLGVNKKLDQTQFHFTPPKNADVLGEE